MQRKKYSTLLFLLLPALFAHAQNFHAIQGSAFAGVLGVHNNPASILATPFKWDINIFSFQIKNSTNAFEIRNYSLISSPANSKYAFTSGNFSRYEQFTFNTQLLNARIALSRKKAIAFGINVRGYGRVKTSEYNYMDTIKNSTDFFKLNQPSTPLNGDVTSSSWVEIFGTYSQTIFDNPAGRLNAGVTVKVSRGLSGAYTRLRSEGFASQVVGGETAYTLKNTTAQVAYSANYDQIKKGQESGQNIKNFLSYTQGGAALDFGAEYLIKSGDVPTVFDGDTYYDYDWKLGLSLLDIGVNQFKPGTESINLSIAEGTVDNKTLDEKFTGVGSVKDFNDSLESIATSSFQIYQQYRIFNPARLVLNADKWLGKDFYINGELSINLSQLAGNKRLYVKELNLLTVTPRWETKRWGVYLPVIYNTEGQFWVGGAFKAGPLLLGVHNFANIFAKNKMQNGGGYIAIVIRSFSLTGDKGDKRNDCPPNK